jgi:lambda family phage tail tape measure protein
MSDATRRLSVRLSVDGAQQARQELTRTGETGGQAFQRIVSGAQGASRALSLLGPALSALSVGALANFARRAVDAVGGLGELADQAGVSTDALQAFRFAATEVGLRNEELERGLAVLTRRIGEAAAGEEVGERAFRRLGVAFLDAGGNARATEGVLADIADRIAAVESPAERARMAAAAFGEDLGRRLIPFLALGRERFEQLTAEALRFGFIADAELIARADQASDRIAKLSTAFSTLATNLLASVAPALSGIADQIGRVAFGVPLGEQITRLEARRADLLAAREAGGGVAQTQDAVRRALEERGLAQPQRLAVEQIDRELAEIDRRLGELRQRNVQFEERAREIVEGRTRAGAGEAEMRRERAAADIAGLRETFDARLRIEREYQERLDRIRRAAEAGAVEPAERQRLETDALRARDEALSRLTRTTTTAVDAEERRIDTLRRQVELAGLADERERFVAERIAGLMGAQRAEAERLAETLFDLQTSRREESVALQEVGRLYEETRTPLERYIAALERLGELRPVLEARFGAERADEIIGRRAQALMDELDQAGQRAGQVEDIGRQLGLTFESAFERAAARGEGFRSVLAGIVQDISRFALRQFVTQPLFGALGAGFTQMFGGLLGGGNPLLSLFGADGGVKSARGNAFSPAGLIPFQRGGVVDQRTLFRFAGGWGEMGEAGPEAILPLRRTRDGRLGVETSGSATHLTVNINSPDADGFRRTRTQIAGMAADVLRRGGRVR